jgi:phosphate transport system ATP-binding protein
MSESKLSCENLNLYFKDKQILKHITLSFIKHKVTTLIGPSGCGKSTLLKCFNRMHELNHEVTIQGKLTFDNQDIYQLNINELRRRVGMVFQKPNPLPMSIFDNVAYGLRIHGYARKEIPSLVEKALKDSFLWDEVKDDLKKPALKLSGGQQQRLCIARAIVLNPEVLLMDEPCSALDPISSLKIEELILQLKNNYTIIVVTHNLQQAKRISDNVAFMYLGELVEYNESYTFFNSPQKDLTKNYIKGHLG